MPTSVPKLDQRGSETFSNTIWIVTRGPKYNGGKKNVI